MLEPAQTMQTVLQQVT